MEKMKTKTTLIVASAFLWLSSAFAQAPCSNDLNGFVAYKNVGGTGSYQLRNGFEEKASQTYNYSGPGRITSVRVSGSHTGFGFLDGVPLKISVYNVDASGKPTTLITSANKSWMVFPDNAAGFIDVTFPGGVAVSSRFAITVEIRNGVFPFGSHFNLQYTGNGEGGLQDLASLAGTSTGGNWTSAKNSFGKDGDFYIVPNMAHINNPMFTTNATCYSVGSLVTYSNSTQMTTDSMFNKIGLVSYAGSNKFYTWNFGDGSAVSNLMNPTHTYTAGGVYTTTLTTKIEGWAGICTKTYTSSVSVGLSVSSTGVSNVLCNGASTGSFVAVGQLGAPSYSYNINGGSWQASPNFTSLVAGAYTLNIKDSKGCTSSTIVTITQPSGISFSSVVPTNATCGTSTGAISVSASGGVAPLTYKLDGGSYGSITTFTALSAGPHFLTVKDANGCTTVTLVIINSTTGPVLLFPNVINVSCFGGNDGSISLSSFGGTGSIQYSIDGGTTYQASPTFTGVVAGAYTCVVKDNAGCTNHQHITVTQGPALSLSLTSSPALCNGSSDGVITVASTGGTGVHKYSINGVTYQLGVNFTGLPVGTYTVYVKDITSCIKTQTISVGQPTSLIASLSSVAATCNGSENGSITALATGGNGGYSYSIGDGYTSVGTFTNLPAGTYTVYVKDVNNCSYTSIVSVTQPAAITTTVSTTMATCTFTNGAILVLAGGGSGSGYQYSINGSTFFAIGSFSGLTAGTHNVLVKDGTGCSVVVSGIIGSAGGPTITASTSQNIACNGGNDGVITITGVTGGTGLIQYSKDGITFQASNVLTGLAAGVYVVQVKDANGCIATVTKTLTQPSAFLISPTTASVSCYGSATGSATIAASGGAGFLVYSINGGATYQAGTVFNSLPAGNYTVVVKDAANCTGSKAFTIIQGSQINVSLGVLNTTCYGATNGQISVSATGGVAPYQYSINGGSYSSVSTFTNLVGNATYTLYVKDANNCVVSATQYVFEPAVLNVVPVINNVTCAGGNNGVINLNVTGGSFPYSYSWSNGANTSSNVNLVAGVYTATVTDFYGCVGALTFSITQPSSPIIVNGLVTSATSGSSANGSIDITVTGGSAPYTYLWSNGATTQDLTGVNPGAYMVTITDANGCTLSSTFNVGNVTGLANIQVTTSEVKVYPNPANEYTTIEATGYRIEKVELVNLLGQTVFAGEVNGSVIRINTTDFLNGTYFAKIYFSNNNTITKKVTISK